MSDKTRRLLASRKAHMGVVTRKGNEFDKIKTKPTEEITAYDTLLAETLLEPLTEKIAKIGEINLKILDATETSDEALEAEIFRQDEIETEVKSLTKSIQKWLQNIHLMSTKHHPLAQTTVTMFVFLELNFPLLMVSKDWKTFFDMFKGTVHEQQSLPKVQKLYYIKGAL